MMESYPPPEKKNNPDLYNNVLGFSKGNWAGALETVASVRIDSLEVSTWKTHRGSLPVTTANLSPVTTTNLSPTQPARRNSPWKPTNKRGKIMWYNLVSDLEYVKEMKF